MKHKHKKEERPKQRRGRFPHEVDTLLQAQGLATEGFLFCAAGDMDQEGNYCQAWLSFDRKGLYLATGEEHIERKKFAKKPFSRSYTLRELRCFPLEEFDSLQVERYATTGQLIGKKGGDDYPLLRFSIGVTAKIQPFCDCFNALREGKALEPFLAQLDEALYCPKCGERYPDYRRVCPKCIKKRTVALRLFGFFGGYKKQVGLILLLTAIFTAFTVLLPKVSTELLFDNVLNADNPSALSVRLHALGWLIAAIIGMRLLEIGLKIISDYIIAGICPRVLYDIKKKIFGAMQKLSVGFYSSKQTGQLMDRVTSDANHIYWFFVDGLPFIVINILTLCGVIAMMLLTSWRLTLTVLLVIPLVLLLAAMGDRLFRRLHHRKWAAQARLRSTLSDNINGQRIIKVFSQETAELGRFSKESASLMDAQIKHFSTENSLFPLFMGLVFLLSTAVLVIGGNEVLGGTLKVGQLLTFTIYLTMLQGPIEFLSWVFNWWARCVDSAQRVFEIVDAEPEITEKADAAVLQPFRGSVELRELEFEYEPARPILKKISLKAQAGQMLGIVGKTGAGKTTVANLISRLYDAKAGAVFVDGVDVKDISLAQLRRNIGLVSQDIYLFNGTLADNIRYAKPEAGMSEIMAAAKAAAAHDFIMKLPGGYETYVGSGGQSLSGGEKQRVSIARAILQNPKILILDEATAAMDTATERSIQASLSALKQGRTTIAIAHRLSTLREADLLAVIDQGELKEFGAFSELLRKKGEFHNLYQIQQQALAAIGVASEEEAAPNEEEKSEGA